MEQKINRVKTCKNVRELFKRYSKIKFLPNKDDRIETKIMKENIELALRVLPVRSANILVLSYIEDSQYTNIDIAARFEVSESTIERWQRIALLEFAEAFRGSELEECNE